MSDSSVDMLPDWERRYPPEGSWVSSRGRPSGRFTWRGQFPVISGQGGDIPLSNGVELHLGWCSWNWSFPRTNSHPTLFVGENVAVEIQELESRSRLVFHIHPIVPKGPSSDRYVWGTPRICETALPSEFGLFRRPVGPPAEEGWGSGYWTPRHQFGSYVTRGLVGLAEHHPELLEQLLTLSTWEQVHPYLRRGQLSQRQALRSLLAAQAHAEFSDFPELGTLPRRVVRDLLAERYPQLDALTLAKIVRTGAEPFAGHVRRAFARLAARHAEDDAAYAAQQKRARQADLPRAGLDEFGPFVEFRGRLFDEDDLTAYLRTAGDRASEVSATHVVLERQRQRGKAAAGRDGRLEMIVERGNHDTRAALRLFWPVDITVPEHLALLALRKERRRTFRRRRAELSS